MSSTQRCPHANNTTTPPEPYDFANSRSYSAITSRISGEEVSGEELFMLEIVWRNPNSLVQERVTLDKTLRHNSETGETETIYSRRTAVVGEGVEFQLVVDARQPLHAA